jgi:hypothetical protein
MTTDRLAKTTRSPFKTSKSWSFTSNSNVWPPTPLARRGIHGGNANDGPLRGAAMSRSVPVQGCGRMNSRALRFSQGVSARARYRRLRIETGGDANDAHGDDATGRLSYDWPALRCGWHRHEGRQPLSPGDRDHSLSEEQVAAASKRPLRWRTTPAHAPRSSMIAGTTRSISTRSNGSRFEAARRRISGEESAHDSGRLGSAAL